MIQMTKNHLNLSNAQMAQGYLIEGLEGPETDCRRLIDLGFTPGEEVDVVRATPLGDPLVVAVRGSQLALRRREAAWIRVR